MKAKQSTDESKDSRIKNLGHEINVAVQGVTKLAFIAACGVASYVLWFSSNSLTLKVVAGVLVVHTAVMALALSTKR